MKETELNLSEAQEIQFIFPDEPDWTKVKDEVLVELVKDYISEQNCATSAILQLSIRKHPAAIELAKWLLEEKFSDKWLKKTAREILDDL